MLSRKFCCDWKSCLRSMLPARILVAAAVMVILATVAAAESPRVTDDPQGRVFIALDESGTPVANAPSEGGVFDPQANLEAMAREKTRQIEAIGSPLVVPAAAFTDDGLNPDSMFFPFGGGYFQGGSEHYGCLVAPAYLPHGAVVTNMFVTIFDNDATYDIDVNLRKVDNFNGIGSAMAAASSSGAFAGVTTIQDGGITNPTVFYPDYSYYVTTCVLSGDIRIYSVRLYFN